MIGEVAPRDDRIALTRTGRIEHLDHRVITLESPEPNTNTQRLVLESLAQSADDIRRAPVRLARFSESARSHNVQFKGFLFTHIYNHPLITQDSSRSIRCLEELFAYYLQQPHSMPESHEEMARNTPRHIVVCDYIAGMTDQFLLRQHHEHLGSPVSALPSIARAQQLE